MFFFPVCPCLSSPGKTDKDEAMVAMPVETPPVITDVYEADAKKLTEKQKKFEGPHYTVEVRGLDGSIYGKPKTFESAVNFKGDVLDYCRSAVTSAQKWTDAVWLTIIIQIEVFCFGTMWVLNGFEVEVCV